MQMDVSLPLYWTFDPAAFLLEYPQFVCLESSNIFIKKHRSLIGALSSSHRSYLYTGLTSLYHLYFIHSCVSSFMILGHTMLEKAVCPSPTIQWLFSTRFSLPYNQLSKQNNSGSTVSGSLWWISFHACFISIEL